MARKGTLGIVVRVSDVKGRDKRGDRYISPDEQVRTARTYCESAGFDVTVIEPRDENVSHTTALDDRPGMGEALRLVESGQLAGIAVSSQDRIGPLLLTRELKARLHAAGAVLKVADNPAAEVLDARGYGKLPAEYMSLMHEAQREEIGLRWGAAQRNARERGVLPEREAYGWRRRADGRVELDKRAARRMREAFQMRADGAAFSVIANRFRWSNSTTRQRLTNPRYMGVDGLLPAIVDRQLFEAAQAVRPIRPAPNFKRRVTRDTLLGLACCAGCGKALRLRRRKRADGSFVDAYFCTDQATTRCPERAYVHCDDLEEYVEDWFEDALQSAPRMVDVTAAAADLEQAATALDRTQAELDEYVGLASAFDSKETFRKGLEKRQARVRDAQERVRSLSGKVATLPAGGSLAALWSDFDAAERRVVLRGFLDRVEVRRGASSDLEGCVRIFWSDGSLADVNERVRVAAA